MFKQKTKPRFTGEFHKLVSAHNTEPEVQDKLKVSLYLLTWHISCASRFSTSRCLMCSVLADVQCELSWHIPHVLCNSSVLAGVQCTLLCWDVLNDLSRQMSCEFFSVLFQQLSFLL